MSRRPFPLVVGSMIVFGIAGCGGVDTGSVEDEIKKNLKEEAGLDVTVKCPEDVEDEVGKKFTCDLTGAGGGNQKVEVTLREDDKFDFRLAGAAAEGEAPAEEEAPAEQGAEGAPDAGEDEAAITTLIEAIAVDPSVTCEFSTPDLVEALGGAEACAEAASAEEGEPVTIDELVVEGDTATAKITDSDGTTTSTFERSEDGRWLLSGAGEE